jgi:hypothetical protein
MKLLSKISILAALIALTGISCEKESLPIPQNPAQQGNPVNQRMQHGVNNVPGHSILKDGTLNTDTLEIVGGGDDDNNGGGGEKKVKNGH